MQVKISVPPQFSIRKSATKQKNNGMCESAILMLSYFIQFRTTQEYLPVALALPEWERRRSGQSIWIVG